MPKSEKPQEEKLFDIISDKHAYGSTEVIDYPLVEGEILTQSAEALSGDHRTEYSIGEVAVSGSREITIQTRKEKFLEKTKNAPWTPRSRYELTLACQTLPLAINQIAGRMEKNNQEAARNMYESAQHYFYTASRAISELSDAYALEGDTEPSVGRIRDEYMIKMMVAEHLLAVESFDDKPEWLSDKKTRKSAKPSAKEARLQQIMKDIEHKPAEELLADWQSAIDSNTNAAEFWEDQLRRVQDSSRVEQIQRENLTRGL